ncbi:MAG: hypothetical protein HY658_06480 [Actinobacteria bacterium]|nr:hypothetical protein [Actinomycetota bacterium]
MEAVIRSVGRNGHRNLIQRLFRIKPRYRERWNSIDFHERGEDVWKALRF